MDHKDFSFTSKMKDLLKDKNIKDLYTGAGSGFIIKSTGALLAFTLQILLTRIIGVEQYGVYAYVITWINTIIIISQFGFQTSTVRFISEYNSNDNIDLLKGFAIHSKKIVSYFSIISIVILIVVTNFTISNKSDSLYKSFIIASFLIPLLSFVNVLSSGIRGFKKIIKSLYPSQILKPIIIIIALISLNFLTNIDLKAYHIFLLIIFAAIICILILYQNFKNLLPKNFYLVSPEFKKSLWFSTSRDMMLISGFSLLLFQADTIMVGSLINTTTAGIYSVTSRIAGFIVFILVAVNSILSPIVSELYYSSKKDELEKIYKLSIKIVITFSLILSFLLIIFGKKILGLFDNEFIKGYPFLVILIIGQLGNAFVGSTGVLLNMTGNQRIALKILSLTVILNIVLNYILINNFGAIGASISTASMNIITNIIFAIMVYKILNITPTPFYFKKRV